jgi:hypothetical protein
MDKLNIVIQGNGLNKDGPACFNMTHSLLKGEALHVFNSKAAEQKEKTKKLMFNVFKPLWNMCSLLTILCSNRKLICATTCFFTT